MNNSGHYFHNYHLLLLLRRIWTNDSCENNGPDCSTYLTVSIFKLNLIWWLTNVWAVWLLHKLFEPINLCKSQMAHTLVNHHINGRNVSDTDSHLGALEAHAAAWRNEAWKCLLTRRIFATPYNIGIGSV